MKRARLGLLVTAALVASGCATIVKGRNQTVTINSNVEGAEIFFDNQRVGTTPFVGLVPRNKTLLRAEKAGYQPTTVALSKAIEPVFWGNVIIGGTLGSITDFATGAAFQYAPASIQVELKAASQTDEEFARQVTLRGLAMIYIDEISHDLGRGSGDHLSALLSVLNAPQPGAIDVTAVRQALTASQGDPIGFGRRIVDLK